MTNSVLFILFSLFVSCSQAEKQPSYYRYKDPELPFTMVLGHPFGRQMSFAGSRIFGAHLYRYDQRILNDYQQTIGYEDQFGGSFYITYHPFSDYPDTAPAPTLCFPEAQKTKDGYQINLTQLIQKSDGTYEKKAPPAWLDVLRSEYPEDAGEGDAPAEPYPGGAMRESHLITPRLPKGSLPKDKSFYIEVRYFVIVPNEPDYHKKAKEKANKQLCEAARSFTWIISKDLGSPPNWSKIKLAPELPEPKRN